MNSTNVEEHRKESGDKNLLVTINDWLGSGGEGIVVLDNLNVSQVADPNWTKSQLANSSLTSKSQPIHHVNKKTDKSSPEMTKKPTTTSTTSTTTKASVLSNSV